jgi:hypothetical protein
MGEMVRHPQTKGRATENANVTLEPPGGRCGYKRRAKFQPTRCQESERGTVLRNAVRTRGCGALLGAAPRAGAKALAEGEGPVLGWGGGLSRRGK